MYEDITQPLISAVSTNLNNDMLLKKGKKRIRHLLRFFGPAFIVSVAYIDPGNFATNISGGSIFNYTLMWVILWSNLMAIFLQSMSAKLGIATNHNLPQMCGKVFAKKTNIILWVVAEIAAMATDLAEFLGGTLGFYLLFNMPMLYAALLTGLITFIIAYLGKYGQRVVEAIIFLLVLVIASSYGLELFLAKPNWMQVGTHTLIPSLPNGEAIFLAAGILGATVMPHVIYLHSDLVQYRNKKNSISQKKYHLKIEKIDIAVAMNIAFIVNAAMLIVSASVFNKNGMIVDSIMQAHKSLTPLLGSLSSCFFGIALLASGLSSSAVGTMAGQTIMDGFINLNIPLNIRRIITMLPAIVIIMLGTNPMQTLIVSQVVLSFALPLAIIPLLIITNNKKIMGPFVNNFIIKTIGLLVVMVIIVLNITLLITTFF